ncbi:P-loop containing nucleoside triphosphate hydrolase protein [Mycena maculata]|uniref:RNA helicase n=1 Tax=Mycena maculata TaxID=230809 RepID=A0AAD7JE80_9AGAR|nr:P-loop containing nucleoside triphosphate hydrolase protein [Mycena maculata]
MSMASLPHEYTSKGDQVRQALEHRFNSVTGNPHSEKYMKLLESRKKLPVYEQMDEFYKVFGENQVIIVAGDTGCGKTTQIPQFVAYSDLPDIKGKLVGCTQPRRMSAMSVARLLIVLLDPSVKLGAHVGYSVRFEDMTTPEITFLKYMTDGKLLREAIGDPDLRRYSTIILDEVHERTLATDILMSLLKGLVKKRADLKLIIMSATVDYLKLQKYFELGSAGRPPIFKITGKTFPVEIFYTQRPEPDYFEAAIRTVLMIHRAEKPGDILLFLTGEQEIEKACMQLELKVADLVNQDPDSVGPLTCIPLYSSLPPELQQHIYHPPPSRRTPDGPPGRKIVVATNIAETSLTIEGIVYVVDPGFSKQAVYNPRIRVESHLVSPISKASAHQRAGRAGRTKPGKCFRLYTENDFMSELEEQTYPDILRSNLGGTVLQLIKLGIKASYNLCDLVRFEYVDAPSPESLLRALEMLNYLGALDDEGNLTPFGAVMAEFPLEPQLAKVLIVSPEFQYSDEILTIAAMLSVPHVWRRPMGGWKRADAAKYEAKALLTVPHSDHLTVLKIYKEYRAHISNKNWAFSHHLSPEALSQADKARNQLQKIMERLGLAIVSISNEQRLDTNIRKVLVCGFFMQVANKKGENYVTCKDNQVVALDPSCGLRTKPDWVIFNEFILTTRPYIRTITQIEPKCALLDHAPTYFDLSSFPDGPAKHALQKIAITRDAAFDISERLRLMNL